MKKLVLFLFFSLALSYAKGINIGSENAYKPFAYIDKNGNATGFDNELVRLVVSYIPNAEANFVSVISFESFVHGKSSSEHPLGNPLYPVPTITLFLIIQAPT